MEPPSSVQRPSFGLLRIIKLEEEQTLFPLTTRHCGNVVKWGRTFELSWAEEQFCKLIYFLYMQPDNLGLQ